VTNQKDSLFNLISLQSVPQQLVKKGYYIFLQRYSKLSLLAQLIIKPT